MGSNGGGVIRSITAFHKNNNTNVVPYMSFPFKLHKDVNFEFNEEQPLITF
jgi:hypothetical protein